MVGGLKPGDRQVIGPYRLVGRLGSGGMGLVYLGLSAGGRPVAVKVIRAELAADQEFRVRFGREVAAARRVSGLFTALVVDADVDGPVPWLATAYVAGPSLSEAVTGRGPMSAQSTLALAAGLAEGRQRRSRRGRGALRPEALECAAVPGRAASVRFRHLPRRRGGIGDWRRPGGRLALVHVPRAGHGRGHRPPSDTSAWAPYGPSRPRAGGLSVRGRGPSWPTASSTARRVWTGCPPNCARWSSAAWPGSPSGRRPTRCWPKRLPSRPRSAGPGRVRPVHPAEPAIAPFPGEAGRPAGSGRAAGGGRWRRQEPGICLRPRGGHGHLARNIR